MTKIRIASTVLIAVQLSMFVSGCASLTVQPTGELGSVLDTRPDSVEIRFGIARVLERNGKLTEAREAYQEILNSQSHPSSLHRLGVIEIRQNRLDTGLQHLSQAVAAGDASAELLGDYGYAQFLSEDLTSAEDTLRKAVAIDPSHRRNVNNLAIVLGKQDRLQEALQMFRQTGPESEALANLAFVQSQSEDLNNAKQNYNRALDLDPNLQIAAVGLFEVAKHMEAQNNAQEVIPSEASASSKAAVSKAAVSKAALPPKATAPEVIAPGFIPNAKQHQSEEESPRASAVPSGQPLSPLPEN